MLHCSVKEAQRRIDSSEFADWLAEYELEPWGEDWKQTAFLGSVLYSVNGKQKRIEELMPGRIARRQQSAAEMQQRLDLLFKAVQAKQEHQAKVAAKAKGSVGDKRL